MKAFPDEFIAAIWKDQMELCTAYGKTIKVTVTFKDRQNAVHKAVFVLPLNKLRDISNGAYYDYRWCASAEDLMDKVKTLWNIQYYKLQSEDPLNLYTDTWLVVRDER